MTDGSETPPESSQNSRLSIAQAIQLGVRQLSPGGSDSAKIDSEILLLKVLNDHAARSGVQQRTKSWLLTWPEKTLSSEQLRQFTHFLNLRSEGIPVAYITGKKDFWTLTLNVSPATLIPRPETELLVECALEKTPRTEKTKILDLGTGSGAIALAIASERHNTEVLATDISVQALAVAQKNAHELQLFNVTFCRSHWFDSIPGQQFDIIVSNPPYIAEYDPNLEENVRKHEPLLALHSENNGLDDINHIIKHCRSYLKPGGWILFEHGFAQAQAVQTLLKKQLFTQIATLNDLNQQPRVTMAKTAR